MNRSIAVACLVLIDNGSSILVTQRPVNKSLGGLWEFPGGKIEAGETAEAALRREIREELRFDMGRTSPLTPVRHSYDFASITLIPFLSRCEQRPFIQLMEHSDHRWISIEEIGSLSWAPADLPIIDELRAIL